jgi:hypothetical protein
VRHYLYGVDRSRQFWGWIDFITKPRRQASRNLAGVRRHEPMVRPRDTLKLAEPDRLGSSPYSTAQLQLMNERFVAAMAAAIRAGLERPPRVGIDQRPGTKIAFFAGIWTTWHGKRGTKSNPVEGEHQLFGFLTTNANAEVGAIHPKAMPVILTTEAEIELWMTAPAEEALKLQRALPDGSLAIVMTGEKEDPIP